VTRHHGRGSTARRPRAGRCKTQVLVFSASRAVRGLPHCPACAAAGPSPPAARGTRA
jgi:hypothetical protein